MPSRSDPSASENDVMRPRYVSVLIVWLVTLAALYAFQEYFG